MWEVGLALYPPGPMRVGVFDSAKFRRAFVNELGRQRGFPASFSGAADFTLASRGREYDKLAELLSQSLTSPCIFDIAGLEYRSV